MTTPISPAGDDALEAADRVIRVVAAKASSAEAEATVTLGEHALTRFAGSTIHQNVAESRSNVSLRVALDGQVARARADGPLNGEALGRLADAALEVARVRPVDPAWPGVAPRAAAPEGRLHWDEGTALATPDERARIVEAFVRAGGGLETAGSCSTELRIAGFANSAGQRLSGAATIAELDGIARTATSDGSGRVTAVAISALDGAIAGEVAARKARESSDPTDIEPGRYEVVLEPRCVADILQFLFVYGLNGRPVEEGRSFARIGETQFDRSIGLRDDVTDPDSWGLLFDMEGTPKRRVDVISGGVTETVLHTRRTAAAAGSASTGNATQDADALGALPSNPVLDGGDIPNGDMVGRVGRGILVTDFWYTRILDPRTQVVTGLTRNGVWLIEDGRPVRPLRNLRFTQSYLEALGPGNVRGLSAERALIRVSYDAVHLVPTVHLGAWNFTGGARG